MSFSNSVKAQDVLGDIKMTAITYDQRNWLPCDGRLMPIAQHQALFSLLGTTYGGDGEATFALPDLRGRVPVGQGLGAGLPNYNQGQTGGSTTNTLSTSNLPAHSHSAIAVVEDGDSSSPTNNFPAGTKLLDKEYASMGSATTMNPNMIGITGSSTAVNNMQPYTVVRYVICYQGTWPAQRNN